MDADALVPQEDVPDPEDDGPPRRFGGPVACYIPAGAGPACPGCSSMYWM
jgi:hypothetical protein